MNNTNESSMELLDNARQYNPTQTDNKIILVLKSLKSENSSIYTRNDELIDSIILLDDAITKGYDVMELNVADNLLGNREELISDLISDSDVSRAIFNKMNNNNNNLCIYCNRLTRGYLLNLPQSNTKLDLMVDPENKQLKMLDDAGELVTTCKIKYCPMCNREL